MLRSEIGATPLRRSLFVESIDKDVEQDKDQRVGRVTLRNGIIL